MKVRIHFMVEHDDEETVEVEGDDYSEGDLHEALQRVRPFDTITDILDYTNEAR